MSFVQTTENKVNNVFRVMVAVWFGFFSVTSCLVVMLMVPAKTAKAAMMVEQVGQQIRTDFSSPSKSTFSHLVQGADDSDPCLSLIPSSVPSKNIPNARYNISMQSHVYTLNQPAKRLSNLSPTQAGTTAALGLMFGVRFALIPSRKKQPSKVKSKSPSSILAVYRKPASLPLPTALSIAAYRSCKKDFALNK